MFSREGKRAGQALGYSPYMQPVHVDDGAHLNNRIADVEIVGATGTSLSGRLVAAQVMSGVTG
jgi:tRNA-2-methylthio-N6-dimethylallyladenosine synthase